MNIVNEIDAILKEEQDLLLAGRLDELADLAERKSRLAARLARSRPDLPRDSYADLVSRASQNEALLASARRGLKAALAQIRQLTTAGEQSTYSKDGRRQPLSRRPASVIQKL